MKNITQANLAFIVGAPRSGTTLLMSILNSHPEIHALVEVKFFLFYLNKYNKTDFREKKNRVSIVEDFFKYFSHKKKISTQDIFDKIIKIDEDLINKFIESDQVVDYASVVKILYYSISILSMHTPNPKVILEKNPLYTQHIGSFLKLYPTTKYIGIIRNHRDAVSSRVSSIASTIQDIQYYAKYWELINSSLYKYAKKYKNNILLIFYTDLIKSPDQTIQKCLDFLNINIFHDYTIYQSDYKKLVETYSKDPILKKSLRWQKKFGDLSRPINPEAINKWKERLNSKQVEEIDKLCIKTSKLFYKDIQAIEQTHNTKYKSGYYKAILNYQTDEYRFKLPPKINFFLEKSVRKIGII